MVSNSPSYLLRLWPPFLNKLLYATDAGLRTFLWLGELPEGLEKPSSQACLDSVQVTQHHRRLRSFYDSRHGVAPRGFDKMDEMTSNHYTKMPAVLAALAAPGIAGVYYVDLDAVTGSAQIKFHVDLDAIDATPARWRGGAGLACLASSSPVDLRTGDALPVGRGPALRVGTHK